MTIQQPTESNSPASYISRNLDFHGFGGGVRQKYGDAPGTEYYRQASLFTWHEVTVELTKHDLVLQLHAVNSEYPQLRSLETSWKVSDIQLVELSFLYFMGGIGCIHPGNGFMINPWTALVISVGPRRSFSLTCPHNIILRDWRLRCLHWRHLTQDARNGT